MATNPIDYLRAMGGIDNLVPSYNQQQAQQQQLQANQMQIDAAKQKQEQEAAQKAAYASDVSAYLAKPTVEGAARLTTLYPDHAAAIKQSWDMQDSNRQQVDLQQMADLYGALQSGNPDLAKKSLEARIAADKKAGEDTSDDEQIIEMINRDPAKAAGFIGLHLSAIMGADKFSSVLGALGKSNDTHVINQGGALVDDRGNVLYQADNPSKYMTVKNADGTESIVQVGGGDQSSGGGSAGGGSGDTRGNRNNNPGNLKDGPFAKAQPGYQGSADGFAVFDSPQSGTAAQETLLTKSYVGKGVNTIAGIINKYSPPNAPGNTPESTANYIKYVASKTGIPPLKLITAADIPAIAAAQREFENGGQSPSQGPAASGGAKTVYTSQGGNAGTIPGDPTKTGEEYLKTLPPQIASQVKALSDGRLPLPSSFALTKPYWQNMLQATAQYDPTFDAANAKTRAATRKEFTSGKAAANITSFNTVLGHLDTLNHAAEDLHNRSMPIWNSLGNATLSATGDSRVVKFNTAKQAVVSELERAFRGSAGSLAGIRDWEKSLNSSQSPEQLRAAITQMVDLLGSRINALGEQYTAGMGRSIDGINLLDSHARAAFKRLSGEAGGASSDQPVKVSGDADYAKLASGTRFIGPDGKLRTKP
jgi:hypothetical protein